MANYSMSIYKNGRKYLSAGAIAGVTTTRALKMCMKAAREYIKFKEELKKAKLAKNTKKISELDARLKR